MVGSISIYPYTLCGIVVLVTILSKTTKESVEEMKKLYGYLLEERDTAG